MSADFTDGTGRGAKMNPMTVAGDVDRVADRVEESGSPEHWAWLKQWTDALDAAVEAEDEDLCEDLHTSLIVWERDTFRSQARLISTDEVIRSLGFPPEQLSVEEEPGIDP
jgi:hypothetical protein